MDSYQQTIAKSKYARFVPEEERREHWNETVDRYMGFIAATAAKHGWTMAPETLDALKNAVLEQKVLGSMRLMMTAGAAADRDNICAYNCAYLAINHKRKFAEALYILMNGTGVGFSCERQEIGKLPVVPNDIQECSDTIVVADSKLGWAKAYRKYLYALWEGDSPKVDYSKIRPAGAKLRTFGGRASGPEPLRELFSFTEAVFKRAAGRKLSSIEVHDLMCKIGEVVVVGGVRRSALISLSNLTDRRMREAKVGAWWEENRQRALANNSVAYTEKPDVETFLEEWLSLVKSKSGERGIFNRQAAKKQASKRGLRSVGYEYGCNPCSEILLRDSQFCNLTEVVVRAGDTLDDLKQKVEQATTLGTIQSCLTSFQFVSDEWKNNCEEERLLGVSLTGIFDHEVLSGKKGEAELKKWLEELHTVAVKANEYVAAHLSIAPSAAITCVKPSGTVSQLVNCSSGIHPRHSRWYVRTIRMDNKDPMCQFLKEQGVKWEPSVDYPESTTVFCFPIESPEHAVVRSDITAIEHLNLWKLYQDVWCDHKPSVTISVKEEEWMEVGTWVWKHFDDVSGISFLPHSNHTYRQAPYQEVDEATYKALKAITPTNIYWELLKEKDDDTTGSQELACVGNSCEIQ